MSDVQNSDTKATPQDQGSSTTGNEPTSEQNPETAQSEQETQAPARAWYASPWLWGILLFLGIVAVLAWIFWHQWQAHLALTEKDAALVLEQQDRNAGLEAELARLKALLAEEPCIIKERLPQLSQEGQALQIPKQGSGIAPGGTTAPPPASNPEVEKPTPAEAPPPAAPPAAPQSASAMAQKLENATVLVLSQEPSGLQMGTGFFIAPGIVLTNQHVVGSGQGTVYVVGKFQGGVTKAKVLTISANPARDYAVLQISNTDVAPLSLSTQVARTQKISTWGFPSAVTDDDPKFKELMAGKTTQVPEVIYSEGTVSVIQEKNPALIVHTAIVSQGNSGGPLVNEQGEVVGINTYIQMDKQSYRQSSLSIVTADIIKFLQEHNIPFTLASAHKE